MDAEDKIRFLLGTLEPMARYTFPFLCQILGTDDGTSGELVGTGFRCTLGGRRVVITAEHVLREGRERFSTLAISAGNARKPHVLRVDEQRDDEADLAILHLPEDDPLPDDCSFWDESRIDRSLDRLSTDFLFLHGYPAVRSQVWSLPGDDRVLSKSLPYGAMQQIDGSATDLDANQFAINFEPTNVQPEADRTNAPLFDEIRGPGGLSGSPVWRIGISGGRAADWSPESCQLVGIVTQWRPRDGILVATKVTKVLELAASSRGIDIGVRG